MDSNDITGLNGLNDLNGWKIYDNEKNKKIITTNIAISLDKSKQNRIIFDAPLSIGIKKEDVLIVECPVGEPEYKVEVINIQKKSESETLVEVETQIVKHDTAEK